MKRQERKTPGLLRFLRQEKIYWLAPLVVVAILFVLLVLLSQSSSVAPLIYSVF